MATVPGPRVVQGALTKGGFCSALSRFGHWNLGEGRPVPVSKMPKRKAGWLEGDSSSSEEATDGSSVRDGDGSSVRAGDEASASEEDLCRRTWSLVQGLDGVETSEEDLDEEDDEEGGEGMGKREARGLGPTQEGLRGMPAAFHDSGVGEGGALWGAGQWILILGVARRHPPSAPQVSARSEAASRGGSERSTNANPCTARSSLR
jgi:hypothetical protein